jgi:thiamine pyrophosphokinase
VDSSSDSVIVFTGGDPVAADALVGLPAGAYVVAADSGLDHARRLGFRVDAAVGDFDSASPEALEAARDEGTAIEVHPQAKDHTDFELALALAVARGPRRIVVVGGQGGRLDHLLGNALALTRPAAVGIDVEAVTGSARLYVVAARRQLVGTRGELLTLLPVHGPAHGVCTEGLRYPLHRETLEPGSTRGISNQFLGEEATVSVAQGLLLAVQPGEAGPPLADAPEEESP